MSCVTAIDHLPEIIHILNFYNNGSHDKTMGQENAIHDDDVKWKHFPRYWPFVLEIHRSPVNSLQKGQWCGALMFSSICAWVNGWVNNREAGDLARHWAHHDVTVMVTRHASLDFTIKHVNKEVFLEYFCCHFNTFMNDHYINNKHFLSW